MNAVTDASELNIKRLTSSGQNSELSLMELIVKFDNILADCKNDTEVLKVCRYTACRKRLVVNL